MDQVSQDNGNDDDDGTHPGPPVCKLAAESTSDVAEHLRGATGRSHARLASGSLPYCSGVRATSSRTTSDDVADGRENCTGRACGSSDPTAVLHSCNAGKTDARELAAQEAYARSPKTISMIAGTIRAGCTTGPAARWPQEPPSPTASM